MSDIEKIEKLIEASSLGTPAAKAFRESVSEEEAQRLVDRAECCSRSTEVIFCHCLAHWHPHRRGPECKPRAQATSQGQAIEAVQSAVVTAINTLGVTLVGSKFTPITVSPIPDDEVAQILAGSLPVGVETNQETGA